MTLMAVPVTGALATIAKVAETDEGSALVLLELALYEALCDEADRIRPLVDKRFAQQGVRQVQGALQHLAKRYAVADEQGRTALAELAEQLVAVGKDLSHEKLLEQNLGSGALGRDPGTGQFTRGTGVRRKLLDLLGIATGKPDAQMQQKTSEALSGIAGPDANSFTRLRSLGQGLAATGAPGVSAVGHAARVAADIGPEAQRALEPGIRRTAYRYRGTERKPSGAVVRQGDALAAATYGHGELPAALQTELIQASHEIAAYKAKESQRQGAPGVRAPAAEALSPLAGALLANPKGKDDQTLLARVSDFGALTLRKQVPDLDTAKISLAAGKMPPSLGLLFDADGKLVSEAQGFNGDHYLPFDLKNLKRLKGGSYVRTRTTGGLTDEDVYTGLLTGARQITVVSNSGVFTLELDPSLRGGRRYSDKARQMVERYAALTKVIGGGKLLQTDIDPETMKQIRSQAHQRAEGDEALTETYIRDAVDAARLKAKYEESDDDVLMAQADTQARAGQRQGATSNASFQQHRNEIFTGLQAQAREKQIKAYRLDGEGYGAAMKALQTEFPYFIRDQKFTPLQEYLTSRGSLTAAERLPKRGGADIGYTRRNELSPRATIGEETKEQSHQRRTGRSLTPAASGTAVVAQQTAPATVEGTAPPRAGGGLPEPDAPSFEQAHAEAARQQKVKTNSALKSALGIYGALPTIVTVDPDVGDDSDPAVNSISALEFGVWLGAQDNPHAVLTGPRGERRREQLRHTLEALKSEAKRFNEPELRAQYAPETFDSLSDQLDTLGGLKESFAPQASEPALYEPDPDSPKPQMFEFIAQAKADPANLAWAAKHADPDGKLEALAAQYLTSDDETISAGISMAAERLTAMVKWGQSGTKTNAVGDGTHKRAKELAASVTAGTFEREPEVKDLLRRQMAWSLAKAWKQAVALRDIADPKGFGGAAPFVPPGEPGPTAKRYGPRLIRHSASSPVAKALAARFR